ncbi:unnamed protein product [Tuber melanosporum]|uniref:(Perigord truffle) hypothetical protein n=1 Tax=Tuber melanosporum (strain Mel28) TaxID=656061 RepID=D5G5Q0_TUBMM|nr:uncharacterized protein GSTUM_00001428001 [Tuber melanosporum]CAZ79843.1 unnamed protein product [Tuber melanosporum]
MFQCSSPSNRLHAPYHNCWYKGSYVIVSQTAPTNVGDLYAHFRPLPSGTKHSQAQLQLPSPLRINDLPKAGGGSRPEVLPSLPFVTASLAFDASEYFTQVYVSSILVKSSPQGSTLTRGVQILGKESFFRIRRSWLCAASRAPGGTEVFWLDELRNVGLRMKVAESGFGFMEEGEEVGEVECATVFLVRYEELVIRTGHLVDLFERMEKVGGGEVGSARSIN